MLWPPPLIVYLTLSYIYQHPKITATDKKPLSPDEQYIKIFKHHFAVQLAGYSPIMTLVYQVNVLSNVFLLYIWSALGGLLGWFTTTQQNWKTRGDMAT